VETETKIYPQYSHNQIWQHCAAQDYVVMAIAKSTEEQVVELCYPDKLNPSKLD